MTGVARNEHQHPRSIITILFQTGLSYLRWTQTVPMVLAWAFVLVCMVGALFVGFQEQGFALLIALTDAFPGLTERLKQLLQESDLKTESGSLDDELLVALILRAWGVLAAVLMVIAWLRQRLYPSRSQPWSLRRKLGIALLASLIAVSMMAIGGAAAGADAAESVFPLLLMLLLLFGFSAYSLCVGHLIGSIQLALD